MGSAESPIDHHPAHLARPWIDYVLVFVITFAVFTPVLFSDFSPLDDYSMLLKNEQITKPSWVALKSFWTTTSFRIWMPLPLTVWQTIGRLAALPGGVLAAWPFKLTSVSCHCLAAVSALWAIRSLLPGRFSAIVGALVFALHPSQVESVAWTTGLKDVLFGLFSILAMGAFARFASDDPKSHLENRWWWTALGMAILAMLSKPTAMVLPIILFGIDLAIRSTTPSRRLNSIFPMLLPAGLCAIVIVSAQGKPLVERVAFYFQPLIAIDAYSFYLRKLVWPFGLSVDYARAPVRVLQSGALLWTWIIPVAAASCLALLRNRWVLLAAIIFIVPVLPTSGIVPFDMQQYSTVADHYMYLPMFGVGLLSAWMVNRRRGAAIGMLAVLALWSGLSWRYTWQWLAPMPLFSHTLATTPGSWLARSILGDLAHVRGDNLTGLRFVNSAIDINPQAGTALDVRSVIELEMGRYRASADDALRAIPTMLAPLSAAKRVTSLGGALNDRDLAKKGALAWVKIEPDNPTPRNILAAIKRAEAAAATSRPAEVDRPPGISRP